MMMLRGLLTRERQAGWAGAFAWVRLCLWAKWAFRKSKPEFRLAA